MAQVITQEKELRLRVPPHSIEAEQSVLGGIMLDNQAFDRVEEQLVENDFYRHDHRLIYNAMTHLSQKQHPLDVITIHEFLEREGTADEVGGLGYLGELANNTPSAANISAYARIVRERAVIREMIAAAHEIAESGFNPEGQDISQILDTAESKIFKIAEQRESTENGPVEIRNMLSDVINRIEEYQNNKGGITGLETGFDYLDRMTGGLQPADLVIVAGRPSMGKTTFAMNIAEHSSLKTDKPVLVFSMEMPSDALLLRSLSSLSRVDQSRIRRGEMDDHDWSKISSTMTLLQQNSKMYIDDSPSLSPAEVRSRARRLAREQDGISLIVLDYLQLMQVPGMKENRTQEVSEISRSLKALAKELNCPVVALSQLNRSLEQRSDRRPVMADLRESGAIEQDADIIMFVYRDEVYHPDTEHKGLAEIIIGKQRNGPIGTVKLTFNGQWTRFDNYADPEQYGEVN
ncbi:MAG TPA: replicative DNA helicase [Aeromonadales bacterium]|nr:replicative DNA helicase [Aeromonadales bacterium]